MVDDRVRKVCVLLVCTVSMIALCGCGNANSTTEKNETTVERSVSLESDLISSDEEEGVSDNSSAAKEVVAWRQFLRDYEVWVDTYIEFMEKYKDNPTDMSLISEYSEFIQQTAEWAEEAENYQSDLENVSPEILGEYMETLGRITEKLVKMAY